MTTRPPLMDLLKEKVLLLDGGMGTQILARRPGPDDFQGPGTEGCLELLNATRPNWIREIHAAYLEAGADAVETNTFGATELNLADYGLGHRAEELNELGARLAREAASDFQGPRYFLGSMGPGAKLPSLGQVDPALLRRAYRGQARGLLRGGVDALLLETCQDPGQIRAGLMGIREAQEELGLACPVWLQVTAERAGGLLLGTELEAVLSLALALGADLLGLNCGSGPREMRGPLERLAEASPLPISCLPNAGLPENREGRLVYPLGPEAFAEQVAELGGAFGLHALGGCCGTTPEHIRALARAAGRLNPGPLAPRSARPARAATSLYLNLPLRQEPRPLIVGERTNVNGSKAFRDRLLAEDWEGMVELALSQQAEGAHMLDLCVARPGRDERADIEALLPRLLPRLQAPVMVDSTDEAALERALELIPGRAVVNSVNFEAGEERARRLLRLCRRHGAAVVALAIDEEGMARTAGRKLAVLRRLVNLAVEGCGFDPGDLILDPLTFTLATGDEESRRSALETLEALRRVRSELPGTLTILGLSNVSYGFKPAARRALNAVLLHRALEAGLDLAILEAGRILPLGDLESERRRAAEDLLLDRWGPEGQGDPLARFLEAFEDDQTPEDAEAADPGPEARLRRAILKGERASAASAARQALELREPQELLEGLLLPAMREVGERFGAGELQLPFVLGSAEAMKEAVQVLEARMPRRQASRGRVLLATVAGDVHDIGKNLVSILLANNGFEVDDLGIKQPVERILEALEARPYDALGLSGLLARSVLTMRGDLQRLAQRGHTLPVLLGGAALTRDFVDKECQPVYGGIVRYAADAFEGLRILQALGRPGGMEGQEQPPRGARGEGSHEPEEPMDGTLELDAQGRSPWVRRDLAPPALPEGGIRDLRPGVDELLARLDGEALIRGRWAFSRGRLDEATHRALLEEEARPRLEAWKERLRREERLRPRVRYAFLPCRAEGDELVSGGHRWRFPRQARGRRLCIADFFAHPGGDLLALQAVSLGPEAVRWAAELHGAGDYRDYFLFHGLATALAEAGAAWVQERIRRELGIGSQGARFSFGYPSCPDLEGSRAILDLLQAQEMGLELSEGLQLVPEYATAALVAWHPQAGHFRA